MQAIVNLSLHEVLGGSVIYDPMDNHSYFNPLRIEYYNFFSHLMGLVQSLTIITLYLSWFGNTKLGSCFVTSSSHEIDLKFPSEWSYIVTT